MGVDLSAEEKKDNYFVSGVVKDNYNCSADKFEAF
jgi:hypothetical protein